MNKSGIKRPRIAWKLPLPLQYALVYAASLGAAILAAVLT
jgi:hypothetical protein